MQENWMAIIIKEVLSNFGLCMLLLALLFIIIHRHYLRTSLSESEIVYRWLALFGLGFTGIYAFVMHAFFPIAAAFNIGWVSCPFQYEVAVMNLTLGVLGILSFRASYGFRLATVIAAIFILWGCAIVHLYQIWVYHTFVPGNAGSWLWIDTILPLLLLICIIKLKSQNKFNR